MRPRQVTVGGRQRRDRPAGPPPFYRLVYRVVRRVPRGRVVTYGQVAAILGQPRGARAVGMALGALRGPLLDLVPASGPTFSASSSSAREFASIVAVGWT